MNGDRFAAIRLSIAFICSNAFSGNWIVPDYGVLVAPISERSGGKRQQAQRKTDQVSIKYWSYHQSAPFL